MRAVDDPVLLQARRALELGRTTERIQQAVASAPPLDAATLALIRSLIPPAPTVRLAAEQAEKSQPCKAIRSSRKTDAAGGPDAA